jgi:hypothetical protein
MFHWNLMPPYLGYYYYLNILNKVKLVRLQWLQKQMQVNGSNLNNLKHDSVVFHSTSELLVPLIIKLLLITHVYHSPCLIRMTKFSIANLLYYLHLYCSCWVPFRALVVHVFIRPSKGRASCTVWDMMYQSKWIVNSLKPSVSPGLTIKFVHFAYTLHPCHSVWFLQ